MGIQNVIWSLLSTQYECEKYWINLWTLQTHLKKIKIKLWNSMKSRILGWLCGVHRVFQYISKSHWVLRKDQKTVWKPRVSESWSESYSTTLVHGNRENSQRIVLEPKISKEIHNSIAPTKKHPAKRQKIFLREILWTYKLVCYKIRNLFFLRNVIKLLKKINEKNKKN